PKHNSAEELKKEMLANISAQTGRSGLVVGWISYAAAAAVLIVISLAIYYFIGSPRQGKQTTQVATIKNDFLPGTEKALLTLGDGTVINLDSASVGAIAKQGNTSVVKTGEGLIDYFPAGKEPQSITYNNMTTPRGGKYQLRLPDGTHVWLNAASSITYPVIFSGKERSVKITGEVYFEVAHDPSKPFRVHAADQELTVLGTHFNIKAYADEELLTTTLLEGKVSIKKATGTNSLILTPGQQAVTKPSTPSIALNKKANIEAAMAWKNGLFHFENADVKTVMQQLARWYDVEIVYEGRIPAKRFEGEIPMDAPASEVLAVLEKNKIHFRINGKKIIVTPE
ncbi:MAG: FecR domain-containing protein, partial [Chitinophagaceae bacterium]|nr:FecR domain-containing protein [Chitinophagaceae bacterium]